jgi:hypothetical protein
MPSSNQEWSAGKRCPDGERLLRRPQGTCVGLRCVFCDSWSCVVKAGLQTEKKVKKVIEYFSKC